MLKETKREIVETLARDVRLLTLEQIAGRWFSGHVDPLASARRNVNKLTELGLTKTKPAVLTQPDVSAPQFSWMPGKTETPHFGQLANRNRNRWATPPSKTLVVRPSIKAHGIYGGEYRVVRERETEHDALVANVFLHLNDSEAKNWILEDSFEPGQFRSKRPDALLMNGTATVIDVLGRGYGAEKVEAIWNHFQDFRLELW